MSYISRIIETWKSDSQGTVVSLSNFVNTPLLLLPVDVRLLRRERCSTVDAERTRLTIPNYWSVVSNEQAEVMCATNSNCRKLFLSVLQFQSQTLTEKLASSKPHVRAIIWKRYTDGSLSLELRIWALLKFFETHFVLFRACMLFEDISRQEVARALDAVMLSHTGQVKVDGLIGAKGLGFHGIGQVVINLVNGPGQKALSAATLVTALGFGDATDTGAHCGERGARGTRMGTTFDLGRWQ